MNTKNIRAMVARISETFFGTNTAKNLDLNLALELLSRMQRRILTIGKVKRFNIMLEAEALMATYDDGNNTCHFYTGKEANSHDIQDAMVTFIFKVEYYLNQL